MITSLNHPSAHYALRDVALLGQPAAGDLFWLSDIVPMSQNDQSNLLQRDLVSVAQAVMAALLGEDGDMAALMDSVAAALNFTIPLVPLGNNLYVLETFHGPTGAFKDVGARTLAQFLSRTALHDTPLTLAVATSGDTGGAVAHAFANLAGVRVLLFYPKGRISALQEQQLISCGENVHCFSVQGDFDACQTIVKSVLSHGKALGLGAVSTANSINLLRLLPQVSYYVWGMLQAYRGALSPMAPVRWVVPSGNMGNVTAAALAQQLGWPVAELLIACNNNDAVVRFLHGEDYAPRPTIATPANAMDVGAPNNFSRLLHLYGDRNGMIAHGISADRVDDDTIYQTIRSVYEAFGYLLCPHSAVGVAAARRNPSTHSTIVCATAHPAKFEAAAMTALGCLDRSALPPTARSLDFWFDRPSRAPTEMHPENWRDIANLLPVPNPQTRI